MDINTALVAAIGRMQSKMEKQRTHIRKLEGNIGALTRERAAYSSTIDEHNRIFEHDRKEHAAQLGAANVKYETEINNMRKERSNLILDRDWWKETAHAVSQKYEDTIKQLRAQVADTDDALLAANAEIERLRTELSKEMLTVARLRAAEQCEPEGMQMDSDPMFTFTSHGKSALLPERAFKDVAIGEYFNWQAGEWKKDREGHARVPGTGTTAILGDDVLVTRAKDQSLKPCRGCGQYFSVKAAKHLGGDETLCAAGCGEPKPDSIVPGQHTFSPIEGRPFGRNEHEAEEYKPPVIKLEDTIKQIDGAMNAEVFERLARLEQRVMNHEERVKKLEQRTHTHAPDDGK